MDIDHLDDIDDDDDDDDDGNIKPNIITMDMDSHTVAKLSVNFYVQQIDKNKQFIIGNKHREKIIKALYDDAGRFHWCLKSFKLMYYFVGFAIFIISASGTNTPSERGIKATKYFGTPERNRMKGKSLNTYHHIHEKIIEDDFNYDQKTHSIEAAQACKTIMLAFGMHLKAPTKQVYQNLLKEIQEKTQYIDKGMLIIIIISQNIIFIFENIVFY